MDSHDDARDVDGDVAAPGTDLHYLLSLVNDLGAVVWEFDWSTGAFTFVSDACEALLGFPKNEWLVPGFWTARLHPDDAQWALEYCMQCTQERLDHDFEYRMIRADGSVAWMRDIVSVDHEKGTDGCLRGLLVDITARKLAEQRLAKSERNVREALERVGLLGVQLNADGTVVFANAPARQLFGDDVVGRSMADLAPEELRRSLVDALDSGARSADAPTPFETQLPAADGTIRVVRWNAANLMDADGNLAGTVSIGEDVTERSTLERQMRRKAEEFDAIFSLTSDLFFRLDRDGFVLGYAAPTEDALYAPPEAFLGRKLAGVLPTDVLNVLERGMSEAHESGVAAAGQYSLRTGRGEMREWEARFLPLDNGETAVIIRDVTDAIEREQSMRESRDFLGKLLEMLDSGVIVVDSPTHGIVRANGPAERIFGYDSGEMTGLTTRDLHLTEESFLAINPPVLDLLEAGETHSFEQQLKRKDGGAFDAEVSVRSLTGPLGERIATIRDISDRKAAERMTRESEARLRSIVEHAPFGMHFYQLVGDDLLFTGANPAADEILGIENAMFVGKTIEEAFPDLISGPTPDAYRRIAREGGSWQVDEITYDDGRIQGAYEVNAFGIQLGAVVVTFRDITERTTAEERERLHIGRLSALAAELSDAEDAERRRLAEELHDRVSQTLAVAMLHLKAAEAPDGTCALDELARGRDLLNDAIAETRAITTELFPPVLHELGLPAALTWLAEEIERTRGLLCDTAVDVDTSRLSEEASAVLFRAARELLVNVVKHAHATRATVTMFDTDEGVELTIADNGRGFDPEKATSTGTSGFGLFSIRDRLPHLGGNLEIDSAIGEGTRVTLRIPWSA